MWEAARGMQLWMAAQAEAGRGSVALEPHAFVDLGQRPFGLLKARSRYAAPARTRARRLSMGASPRSVFTCQ